MSWFKLALFSSFAIFLFLVEYSVVYTFLQDIVATQIFEPKSICKCQVNNLNQGSREPSLEHKTRLERLPLVIQSDWEGLPKCCEVSF